MPTYTYRCQKCGEEFERFQSMSDEPVKRCPACKGKVQRTFHPVGIVLKGAGFHRNDYRKTDGGSKESGDTQSSEKRSEDKKSDKKPAKNAETKTSEKTTETKSSSSSD